jgi:hypothetical protein
MTANAMSSEASFGGEARRRLVEQFTVSYFNGSLRPNLAERNPTNGREIEYLMDSPQFEKTKRSDIWSYSNAVGTGYQYRVIYRDRRFSDLERLLEMYSGAAPAPEGDGPLVEQRLYEVVIALMGEGRLPKTFKIQQPGEGLAEKVLPMVEELSRSVENLSERVRKLEGQLSAMNEAKPQEAPQAAPEPTAAPRLTFQS